ncbi:MAG: leucine-rich repeat protein [Clostridia bacterium]|nr:leucine-rich repeat protein [Clostridia bacterium]
MRIRIKKKWYLFLLSFLLIGLFWVIIPKKASFFAKAESDVAVNNWIIEEDTIISYLGTETHVVVPDSYKGISIKKIESNAFANNLYLTSIQLPEGINNIGEKAFENCSSLVSVDLPKSLLNIGNYAFSNCTSLKEIVIPGTIKNVGGISGYIFSGCEGLEKAVLEEGIQSIGEYTFYQCTNLKTIELPSTLERLDTWALGYCTKLETISLPENLEFIGAAAFYYCNALNNVVIPNTVTEIGTHSFRGCWNLSNLTLSTSLKSIPYRAFSGCTSLTNIELFEGLQSIGAEAFYQSSIVSFNAPSTLTEIGERAFFECKQLETFTAGEGLKTLGEETFFACSSLSTVKLSSVLVLIPQRVFYNCTSLQKLNIPASVVKIENEAFRGCSWLSDVVLSNGLLCIGDAAFYNTALKELILPNTLEEIGKEAFSNNKKVTKITFPTTLKKLQDGAFRNCQGLEEVFFADGLSAINDDAFKDCIGLKRLSLPDTLICIGKNAFQNCRQLYSVCLPITLETIEDAAFDGCYRLIEVINLSTLPIILGDEDNGAIGLYAQSLHNSANKESYISVDQNGFVILKSDKKDILVTYFGEESNLVLPISFTHETYEISAYAFYENAKIRSVTIPKSVTKIGEKAFYGCWRIGDVNYLGTKQEWDLVSTGADNNCLQDVYCVDSNLEYPPVDSDIPTYIPDNGNSNSLVAVFENIWSSLLSFVIHNIFAINFLLILIWGLFLLYNNTNVSETVKRRKKLLFVIIACTQWVLISGLRADSVGDDTKNYMEYFDKHGTLSWGRIFGGLKNYIRTGEMGSVWYMDFEPLFIVFNKTVSIFTTNHIAYKFIIAIIFMSALGSYVYKYSEDPCLSFILYGALFFNMFSLTGYRQVLSVAFILFGWRFIKERKLIPFLCILFVAYFFHRTTLIFILLYFLANKKITSVYLISIIAILLSMIVFRKQVFTFVKVFVGYEEYVGNYGFKQQTFALLLAALTGVAIWRYKYVLKKDSTAIQYYNGLILAWLMFPLAMESPSCMRLVYDYGFVLLLLVPLIVQSFNKKEDRLIAYGGIYALFALQILTSGFTYAFFWQ